MIDFIIRESKKIMYDCCERHSKQKGLKVENVQLILGLDEKGNNTYTICENYVAKVDMTFLNVLGVPIDFRGYSLIAPQFIQKALVNFAIKNECESYNQIKVMCIPEKIDLKKYNVRLFLYKGKDFIEEIEFSDLFRAEDLQIPT